MGRSFAVVRFAGLALAVALLTAACGTDGGYTVSWQFFASADATAEGDLTVEPSAACGPHGIDAILVTAVNADGAGHQTTGLCTAGTLIDGLATGQWQFRFQQIDFRGELIPPPDGLSDPERSATIAEGAPAMLDPIVTFAPRRACADGMDNDRDGRVDLDDPDCGGDPAGDSEAPLPAAAR
jgi:hypothetical protein